MNELVEVVHWLGGSGEVGSLLVDSFLLYLSQTRRVVSANIKQNSAKIKTKKKGTGERR